jgi:hypothetical protein
MVHARTIAAATLVFLFISHPFDLSAQPRLPEGQSGAQQNAGRNIKKWPVRVFYSGSQQVRVMLEISPSTISLRQKKGPVQEIPISKVTDVTYDNTSHRKSRGWVHAAEDLGQTPLVIGVYPVAGPLVVAAFAAPFKTTTHFVYISWDDAESGSTETALEISKTRYAGVLAELQRLTRKPWRNLPEERKKLFNDTGPAKTANQSVAPNPHPIAPNFPEVLGKLSPGECFMALAIPHI